MWYYTNKCLKSNDILYLFSIQDASPLQHQTMAQTSDHITTTKAKSPACPLNQSIATEQDNPGMGAQTTIIQVVNNQNKSQQICK